MRRRRGDEPQPVERQVCPGQVVGKQMGDVEDCAGFVVCAQTRCCLMCSTEHAGDELVYRHQLIRYKQLIQVTWPRAAVRGRGSGLLAIAGPAVAVSDANDG